MKLEHTPQLSAPLLAFPMLGDVGGVSFLNLVAWLICGSPSAEARLRKPVCL